MKQKERGTAVEHECGVEKAFGMAQVASHSGQAKQALVNRAAVAA
jgi:hypothetical protein